MFASIRRTFACFGVVRKCGLELYTQPHPQHEFVWFPGKQQAINTVFLSLPHKHRFQKYSVMFSLVFLFQSANNFSQQQHGYAVDVVPSETHFDVVLSHWISPSVSHLPTIHTDDQLLPLQANALPRGSFFSAKAASSFFWWIQEAGSPLRWVSPIGEYTLK